MQSLPSPAKFKLYTRNTFPSIFDPTSPRALNEDFVPYPEIYISSFTKIGTLEQIELRLRGGVHVGNIGRVRAA
jgi:hypothetical protein